MSMFKIFIILFAVALLLAVQTCTRTDDKQQQPVFKEVAEIQEVKPDRHAKIKLKRNAKDDYSWEISGDDADELVKIDKKLRKELKME